MDGGDEQALVGVARHDGGAGVAALQHGLARDHVQAAGRTSLVAYAAALGEDGTDLALEVLFAGSAVGLRAGQKRDDGLGGFLSVPRAAHLHPGGQVGDLAVGQLVVLRGHFEVGRLLDGGDQEALIRVTGNHGRAGVAALQDGLARVQPQAAHRVFGVALVAVLGEDGADLVVKELDLIARRGGRDGLRLGDRLDLLRPAILLRAVDGDGLAGQQAEGQQGG